MRLKFDIKGKSLSSYNHMDLNESQTFGTIVWKFDHNPLQLISSIACLPLAVIYSVFISLLMQTFFLEIFSISQK